MKQLYDVKENETNKLREKCCGHEFSFVEVFQFNTKRDPSAVTFSFCSMWPLRLSEVKRLKKIKNKITSLRFLISLPQANANKFE